MHDTQRIELHAPLPADGSIDLAEGIVSIHDKGTGALITTLHPDPAFAAAAAFDRPILQGMCTFGFTGRALAEHVCASEVARLRSMIHRRCPIPSGAWQRSR